MANTVIIFTDGSYIKHLNKCGYGVLFPNKEYKNISRKFKYEPLTNQRAELYAILKSLRKIKDEKIAFDSITLYTDSEYSIKSITEWYKSWEKNNWKNAKGQKVMNQDIIRPIIKLVYGYYLDKIKFKHVNSHTGKQDFESLSNEMADKLANEGALKTILK